MKSLPAGNYALCIAHPGHELRLHGFLEQAKPYVWILTDGSHRTGEDMMMDSIKTISRAIKQGIEAVPEDNSWNRVFMFNFPKTPDQMHIKDKEIYLEIITRTDFFVSFINFIAKNLIKNKIHYLVSDSSEGTNVCHEVTSMMADIAVKLVKKQTGEEIIRFDYAVDKPFDHSINDECIHIQLDDEAVERKLHAICQFPFAIADLKPNIHMLPDEIDCLLKMKIEPSFWQQVKNVISNILVMFDLKSHKRRSDKEEHIFLKRALMEKNLDFFRNEYLRPYVFTEPAEKPVYEIAGEKAVAEGKYAEVITYEKHLKPLREKLEQEILNAVIVSIHD